MNKRSVVAKFLVIVIILLVGIILWKLLEKDARTSSINNPVAPAVTQVDATSLTKKIDEPLFSLMLPSDWEQYEKTDRPMIYYFRSSKKSDEDRNLVLYINTDTSAQTINRLIPVQVQGDQLLVGEMSSDCGEFADSGNASRPQEDIVAKWQGVEFICDLSHINRNAMGVSTKEAINAVTAGGNKFFFLFTDHNNRPDYNLPVKILESFRVK